LKNKTLISFAPPLEVQVQFSNELSLDELYLLKPILRKANLRRWASWARDPLAPNLEEITLRVVGLAEGRRINREFRGKNYATNILTFNYSAVTNLQSDLVMCAPVVINESEKLRISLKEHCAHLIVHSTLHAQGYEHEVLESDALIMETLESFLMLSLGFNDPYGDE
jgi:probable rRNA maturation factor